MTACLPTYNKAPDLVLCEAHDCTLVDSCGKRYLDLNAGICVTNLGHTPTGLATAIAAQVRTVIHVSNYFFSPNELDLAEALRAIAQSSVPNARVFFCNSGTEANEAALKFAILRNASSEANKNKTTILAMEGGFHGRTLGALSTTSNRAYREAFSAHISPNVVFWEWNKPDGFEEFVMAHNVGVVICEPIQGEGGVVPVSLAFSQVLINAHKQLGFTWIVDEVQSGVGRCGSFFAHQQFGWKPEFVTLAKALGNGVPIGAVICTESFQPKAGQHGCTFGGNPLSAAAALWVIKEVEREGFYAMVEKKSAYLVTHLMRLRTEYSDLILEVRGLGLLVGVEFAATVPVASVLAQLKAMGILAISAGRNTLRICPPLVIEDVQIDEFVLALHSVLTMAQAAAQNTVTTVASGICPSESQFPIVIKISGDISECEIRSMAARCMAWKTAGFDVAILHGAGSQINEELKSNNLPIQYVNGQRRTSEEMLPFVHKTAILQQRRIVDICSSIDKTGTVFVPVPQAVFAGSAIDETTYGCVVAPSFCDAVVIQEAWRENRIPVLHFLARRTGTEEVWNANADLSVSALAVAVGAVGVIYGVAHSRDIDIIRSSALYSLQVLGLDAWDQFPWSQLTDGCKLKLEQIRAASTSLPTCCRFYIGNVGELPMDISVDAATGVWIMRKSRFTVGIIGSRGMIGSQVASLICSDKHLVVKRFRTPSSTDPSSSLESSLATELCEWSEINARKDDIDVWVSAAPNGVLKDAIGGIQKDVVIVDVSGDHRHQRGWVYANPYLDKRPLVSITRVSNPGCYSTSVICGVAPLVRGIFNKSLIQVSVTAISSWSGGGRNYLSKFPTLKDTVLPYQALHHAQQREMSDFLGVEVKFVPIVTDQFDRGIVSCIQVTNIANRWDLEKVKALYRFAYDSQPSVQLRLEGIGVTTDVEGTPIVLLSNLSLSGDGHTLFIQSNIDNLMAGGGFSSYANVRRLLGLSAFPPHTRDPRMCFTDALASPSALHVSYTSSSQESYNRFMNALTLPAGFHVATTNVPFFPREMGGSRKKVLQFSCLRMDSPCEWDAVYTQNPNCGHPVKIGRQRLLSGSKLRALWINNKIANVGIEGGLADAEAISSAFAQEFCCSSSEVIPLSTGIIGWQLPRDEMILNVPCITHGATTVMEMARAMMTTDTYPKGICHYFRNGGMLCGVAKGGGMIEPRLGTMLAVLMTDVSFSRGEIDPILRSVVDETFNCCSVDADTSTSDAVVIISSGKLPPVSCEEMHEALLYVCTHLTRHVVWNGEGVMHVMQVNVLGAPDRDTAVKIGKNVVNSPLVKAAMAGNDPNVGRIYGAMGRGIENVDWTRANVRLGAEFIVLNGNSVLWNEQLEKTISDYLKSCQIYDKASPKPPYPVHDNAIVIEVSLYDGSASATVWGGDLTADYVSINSDYRS